MASTINKIPEDKCFLLPTPPPPICERQSRNNTAYLRPTVS